MSSALEGAGGEAASEPLPIRSRQFIVLVALLQGALLYLAQEGQARGWWPFADLAGRVCWYTLVLSVPTAMLLSVRKLDEARYWQQALLLVGVFALLAVWAAWSVTGAPGASASSVLGPFGASTAAAWFVALPYLQCRLQQGRWCAPYPQLFEYAWQNALTLALTAVFVGICWLVLTLWGELFKLIGIEFFRDLFREESFVYLATGTMVGLGILVGRTQHRPVQVARRILFAIFTGLLPLLSAVAVLFVLSLPFTGLAPLWSTRSAAFLLLLLVGVLVVFVNAVYQDGDDPVPYPRWLRHVVDAGLLTLPVFAVLALYALGLRIAQYGWTPERLAGVIAALLLAGHAFGYAWAVLRPRTRWLASLQPVNVAVSLAAIALTMLVNSPLLDPHRVSVNSQVARLEDGRTLPKDFDIDYLRFSAGRVGYGATQALQSSPLAQADTAFADRLASTLSRTERYRAWRSDEELRRTAVRDLPTLRTRITLAPGTEAVEDAWWQALADQTLGMESCLQGDSDCVLIGRDLNGDNRQERLLCELSREGPARCQLYARTHAGWQSQGALQFYSFKRDVAAALRRGEVLPRKRPWPDLQVAGQRASLELDAVATAEVASSD